MKKRNNRAGRERNRRIRQVSHVDRDVRDDVSSICSKTAKIAGIAVGTASLVSALTVTPASALPQSGTVVAGTATISQPTATTLTVNQSTTKTVINWNSFTIGSSEKVNFVQPGSGSIALNRVVGLDPSALLGSLTGTGQVWVVNPNGLLVGPGASIQVGGFLASTMNIRTNDFMSGKYVFNNAAGGSGAIVNEGSISADPGGYVVLAAPSVRNSGQIVANRGTVHLASGDEATLTLDGAHLINLVVSGATAADALGVQNSGTITANGGEVLLTARVAADVLRNVVNNEGVIEAKSIVKSNGSIILDGGSAGITTNSGVLNASGKGAGETGGTVKLLGNSVELLAGTVVDVSGTTGGGLSWQGGISMAPERNRMRLRLTWTEALPSLPTP